MPIISFTGVWHSYARGTPMETPSLSGFGLELEKGQLAILAGPPGSGKSTVLRHLNGLLQPDRGRVLIGGEDTRDKKVRGNLWKRVGLVLQYPEKQFFEETVYREVSFGPRNLGLDAPEVDRRVTGALAMVGLDPREARRISPFRLSGGEQRRVALASVLAVKPGILALDEPTAGIDPGGRSLIIENLKKLKEKGVTIMMAGHNMDEAAALADLVVVMNQGRPVLTGPPGQVFADTAAVRSAGLDLPFPCEVAHRLKQAGLELESMPLTVEEAAEAIYSRFKKRNPEFRIQNPE